MIFFRTAWTAKAIYPIFLIYLQCNRAFARNAFICHDKSVDSAGWLHLSAQDNSYQIGCNRGYFHNLKELLFAVQ